MGGPLPPPAPPWNPEGGLPPPLGNDEVAVRPAPPGRSGRTVRFGVFLALVTVAATAGMGWWMLGGRGRPVSLGRYGGIEIGTTGIKMIGLEYYRTPEGVRFHILDEPLDDNPKLSEIDKTSNDFDPHHLKRAVVNVRKYFKILHEQWEVPAENISIVCSSGLLLPFDSKSKDRNRDRLIAAIRDKTGKTPQFVDAQDEAEYAIKAIVPKKDWDQAVLIGLGGHNLKGGGLQRGAFLPFEVKEGASSFAKKVRARQKATGQPFADAAASLVNERIRAPLQKALAAVEELRRRQKVYFTGASAWAMATYTSPQEFYSGAAADPPRYHCRIRAGDFAKYLSIARTKKPAEIRLAVLSRLEGKGAWVKKVAENFSKIHGEVFRDNDKLVAGASILLSVAQEFQLQPGTADVLEPEKEIYGFRYGHVAWLIGYLGEQSGHLK